METSTSITEWLLLLAAKPAVPTEKALGFINGSAILAASLFTDAILKGVIVLIDEGQKAYFVEQWHQLPIPEAKALDAMLPSVFRTLTNPQSARTVSSLIQSLTNRIVHPALVTKLAEAMGVWTTEHKRLFGIELSVSRQIAVNETARSNAMAVFRKILAGRHLPEIQPLMLLRFMNQAGELHRALELIPAPERSISNGMLKPWVDVENYQLPKPLLLLEASQLNAISIISKEVKRMSRKS